MNELVKEICNFDAGEVARDLDVVCGLRRGPNNGNLQSYSEVRIFLKKKKRWEPTEAGRENKLNPNVGQARVTAKMFRPRTEHMPRAL